MKIVVRGTNWIGDAVMTVPALTALRRAFPDAHITLQTRSAAAQVFEGADFIDDILDIDAGRSKMASVRSQSRALRERRFDLGISFTNSVEAAAVQTLARVPVRFGYATRGRGLLLTDAVPVPEWKAERHEVYYYLNLIEAVKAKYLGSPSGEAVAPQLVLSISRDRLDAAAEFLRDRGVDASRPVIALGVGSTNSRAKRWPADRYASLAERLADELNANILIVGSDGDGNVANDVIAQTRSNVIDLCGQTTVSEAAAILASVDLLISNDMGLAHLAPAVGCATIVIFGPTNEITTRPFSENAEIIRRPVDCSPCMLRDCPIDHRCMTGISVDEVFDRAKAKIGK